MTKRIKIGDLCRHLYGDDWLSQFRRMKTVESEVLLRPLIGRYGAAETARLLPEVMQYLREASNGEGIALPSPVLSQFRRPKARLNEKTAADLVHVQCLEQQFLQALDRPDLSGTNDLLSLVLFSAMRFGACVDAGKLQSLMMALRYFPKRYQDNYWFEFKHVGESIQVWRPDPLTLVLLKRWYTDEHHRHWGDYMPVAPHYHRAISTVFRKLGVWAQHGLSAKRLLDAVSARLSLEVPPVLVDCARGATDNRTLPPEVFYRFLTGKSPRLAAKDLSSDLERPQPKGMHISSMPTEGEFANPKTENRFWSNTRRILRLESSRREARQAIQEFLDTNRSDLAPISQLLASWVIYLLTTHNQWGNHLKPSAIGTQLSSVLVGLRGRIGYSVCSNFLGSEWGEIYLQILDGKTSLGSRQTAQKALSEFHQFMVTHHGVNELDGVALVRRGKKALPQVDANVVFEREFDSACRFFERQRQTARNETIWSMATCQLIALILGFRCGLRRSEVYWLTMDDIHQGVMAEIVLTGKRPVALKSNAANRRIPIYLLLKAWEFDVFAEWLKYKKDSGEDAKAPLFSGNDKHRFLIPAKEIFDPLQSVLQVITGDPKTRFHHLRHSFATHSFLRWMRPDMASPCDSPWVVNQRRAILALRNGDAASIKVAKALHVMIGHAGVEMSMTHYVHSVEWLLFDKLSSVSPRLSAQRLSQLTGLTTRQVQRLAGGQPMSAVAVRDHAHETLRRIVPEIDTSTWCAPAEKKIQIRTLKTAREREWVVDLWQALQVHQVGGGPLSELSERFNIKPETLVSSLQRTKYIFGLKYGTAGHNYYRHRLPHWSESEDQSGMFPFPRQRRHLDLALQMVNRFEVVPERQKRLVRWAVEYFLTNGSARNAHITFRDKASLKKFVRVLEILKVFAPVRRHDEWTELPRYQLWLVMPFEDGSEERKVAWEFWNRGVSLYPFQSKNKVAAAGAEFGRIELCVLALKGRSQPKKNSKRRHHQPSDWGFRLGLYLLAFAYGWRNDTTAM